LAPSFLPSISHRFSSSVLVWHPVLSSAAFGYMLLVAIPSTDVFPVPCNMDNCLITPLKPAQPCCDLHCALLAAGLNAACFSAAYFVLHFVTHSPALPS
jgi:hypothetical protein